MDRTLSHLTAKLLLVILAASSMLFAAALPALATDLNIGRLQAACSSSSDGLTFSVGTDRTGESAEHSRIVVEWAPAGSGAWKQLGVGALTEANGYTYADTVTGLDFTGVDNVDVRATADRSVAWGDGRRAGDTYKSTISVDQCDDPGANVRANFSAGCTNSTGEPTIFVHNDGAKGSGKIEATVVASVDGRTFEQDVTVAVGRKKTVPLTFTNADGSAYDTEDTTVNAKVFVGDSLEYERNIKVDCEEPVEEPETQDPTATISSECTSRGGEITVTMTNPNTFSDTFVITIDGVETIVTVPADTTVTELFQVEDGVYDITVTVGSTIIAESIETVDCEEEEVVDPTATIRGECTDDGGVVIVEITNPSDESVTFTVFIDGESTDITVPASTTVTETFAVADGTHEVSVERGSVTLAEETIETDCEEEEVLSTPRAESSTSCVGDIPTIEVLLENLSDTAADFVVTIDGVVVDTATLADGTLSGTYDTTEGEHLVVVTADGNAIYQETLTVESCTEVAADVTSELFCTELGGLIELSNNELDGTVEVIVIVDGVEFETVLVDAGDLVALENTLPDGIYDVIILVDGVVAFDGELIVDCADVRGEREDRDPAPDPEPETEPDPAPEVRGETLAATGIEGYLYGLLALFLFFFGADMVLTQMNERYAAMRR